MLERGGTMKNDKERVYYNGTYTYEEMLNEMEWSYDFEFRYKGEGYNLTQDFPGVGKPCIVRCYDDNREEEELMHCETYEELINTFRFDDGVLLVDALKSKDISNY